MCLTAEMLALFLNLLAPERVTTQAGRITVHATQADVVWVREGEHWCTDAPGRARDG
jgi:hypothetical protein